MKYFGNWTSREDVMKEFEIEQSEQEKFPSDDDILIAAYETPPYEGQACVIYKEGDKLYEVCGSHCSCYGLEGQWTPEETTKEALAIRNLDTGPYGYGADYAERYKELFDN
jgi:hypothetical protein